MSCRRWAVSPFLLSLVFGCSGSEPSAQIRGDVDASSSATPTPQGVPSSNDHTSNDDSSNSDASTPREPLSAPQTNTEDGDAAADDGVEPASSQTEPSTQPSQPTSSGPESEPTASPDTGPDAAPADSSDASSGGIVHPVAPYCPEIEPNALPACESDLDCSDGLKCFYENTPTGCSLGCVGPSDECGPSAPCGDGLLCVGTPAAQLSGTCACGGGTYCVAPCAGDDDCGAGNSCGSDGRCQPIPCDDGFACSTGRKCDPGAAEGDSHGCRVVRCDEPEHAGCGTNMVCDPGSTSPNGCVRQSCTVGADCECGACSPHGNECVPRPGFCAQLAVTG